MADVNLPASGCIFLASTPTRRALLAAIRDDRVYREAGECWHTDGSKVTARVAEMEAAGWLRWVDGPWPGREAAELTEDGCAVRDGAR